MNPFEMVVMIVFIVTIGRVLSVRRHRRFDQHELLDAPAEDLGQTARLKEEVQQLKQRLHVLERIAVDKENSLAREIDELRDR